MLIVWAVSLVAVLASALLAIFVLVRLVAFGQTVVRAIGRGIARLLLAVLAILACSLLGALIGLAAAVIASDGPSDPTLTGVAAGGLSTVALVAIYLWYQRPARPQLRGAKFDDVASKPSEVPPDPIEDRSLAAAWLSAEALLPRASINRLRQARLSCRLVLRHAEAYPHDLKAIEGAILVTRHVPLLVQEAVTLCDGASLADRERHQSDLLSGLEMLGSSGAAYSNERRADVGQQFGHRIAHIRNRTIGNLK